MKTIQQAQSDKTGKSDISSRSGFTLLEVLIATALFGLVVVGTIEVYIMCNRLWHATSLNMQTVRASSLALSRMIYGMDTNNGLRAASSISVANDMKGMWTGTDHVYPPAPGDSAHFLNNGLPDGSWRIISTNVFDGERCIDFNKVASNIVVWAQPQGGPLAPGSVPERETRQLICNYVSDAVIMNNGSGVSIQLTILRREGRYTSTNQIGTFVKRRN